MKYKGKPRLVYRILYSNVKVCALTYLPENGDISI